MSLVSLVIQVGESHETSCVCGADRAVVDWHGLTEDGITKIGEAWWCMNCAFTGMWDCAACGEPILLHPEAEVAARRILDHLAARHGAVRTE